MNLFIPKRMYLLPKFTLLKQNELGYTKNYGIAKKSKLFIFKMQHYQKEQKTWLF